MSASSRLRHLLERNREQLSSDMARIDDRTVSGATVLILILAATSNDHRMLSAALLIACALFRQGGQTATVLEAAIAVAERRERAHD